MKKILLTLLVFVGLIANSQSLNYGQLKEAQHRQRVENDTGTYYNNYAPQVWDNLERQGIQPYLLLVPDATKTSVLYSQIGSDFTVTRASKASRVRNDGYIEFVQNNIATIDYTDGTPSLHVQPASTNKIAYYKSFENSYWTKNGLSVDTNSGSYYPSPFKDSSGNIVNCARKLVASEALPKIELGTGIDMTNATTSAKGYVIKPINEKEYTLNGIAVNFDTETYGTGVGVTKLADGYYYLTLVETSGSAEKNTLIGTTISSGDMCYLSYSQLEEQSAATSPISDVTIADGAEMSRAEDICETDVPNGTYEIIETLSDGTQIQQPIFNPYRLNPGSYSNIIGYSFNLDNSQDWYGVEWDTTQSSTTITKIGNVTYQNTLPVQSNMRTAVINDDKTINYYLSSTDKNYKEDGTLANLDGSDGQVMVIVPVHYYKFERLGTKRRIKISLFNIEGFTKVDRYAISAYEGYYNSTTGKLESISDVLPTTNKYRSDYRSYAAARGDGWCQLDYYSYLDVFYLYLTEYADFNIQNKIAGATNASSTDWSNYNGYNPVLTTGESNIYGNNSQSIPITINSFTGNQITDETITSSYNVAVALAHSDLRSNSVVVTTTDGVTIYTENSDYAINYTNGNITVLSNGTMADNTNYLIDYVYLTDFQTSEAVYRGIENIYGHIWKFMDGINIHYIDADSCKVYVSNNLSAFADNTNTDYFLIGNTAVATGYIRSLMDNSFLPNNTTGASSSTYIGDYHYASSAKDDVCRVVLVGGSFYSGSFAGLAYSVFYRSSSYRYAMIGGRLCLKLGE